MTVELTLVRHGRTSWNAEHRLLGWTDVPLDEVGERQATLLGTMLSGGFDGVWSSDLVRALATARLAGWEPVADARLREIDFGSLEGRRWDELNRAHREALANFDGFRAPGGESAAALLRRVTDFLDSRPPGSHLVVTHGGVIRAVLRSCGVTEAFPSPGTLYRVDWTSRKSLSGQTPTT